MTRHKVAMLVGSLRKESINRKIALSVANFAKEALDCRIVEIGDLPLLNEDIDDLTGLVTLDRELRPRLGASLVISAALIDRLSSPSPREIDPCPPAVRPPRCETAFCQKHLEL